MVTRKDLENQATQDYHAYIDYSKGCGCLGALSAFFGTACAGGIVYGNSAETIIGAGALGAAALTGAVWHLMHARQERKEYDTSCAKLDNFDLAHPEGLEEKVKSKSEDDLE